MKPNLPVFSWKSFNELWDYCKGHWLDRKIAEIEHDGFHGDGMPKNPIVVGVREFDLVDGYV